MNLPIAGSCFQSDFGAKLGGIGMRDGPIGAVLGGATGAGGLGSYWGAIVGLS